MGGGFRVDVDANAQGRLYECDCTVEVRVESNGIVDMLLRDDSLIDTVSKLSEVNSMGGTPTGESG